MVLKESRSSYVTEGSAVIRLNSDDITGISGISGISCMAILSNSIGKMFQDLFFIFSVMVKTRYKGR